MTPSISEIIKQASEIPKRSDRIDFLVKNDCFALRTVLRGTYDKTVKFLIPPTRPPWKKNGYTGVEGMLHKEARRLRIFVDGGGYGNLKQHKREELFIKLLEDIDDNDAELLCHMITQKPFKNIPVSLVTEAFPTLIESQLNEGTN